MSTIFIEAMNRAKIQTKDSREGKAIKHISFYSELIETMGYDPQRALLEVRLMNDSQVRQYRNVPEELWYSLRGSRHPDTYFRRYICGCYAEAAAREEFSLTV